ncbi:MAG: ABC transporter ATP-binding protein, partial [Solirubrobacteraceae bacterium]
MSSVALQQVSYSYPGAAVPALRDLSLEISPGEVVVVAGESGSGKSTLLRAISGLVPHFHGGRFAGRVTVGGMDTREHGPGELAAAVGTVFQDPEAQIVTGTVRAEIAFALENLGRAPAAIARAVEETALALGLDRLLDRSTAELSGGERQRVVLAAALATLPPVLVLDEPTSQLDPVAADELIGLLRRVNEDRDVTIVLAEHRLERCLTFADRVLALQHGRLVCDATPGLFLAWAAGESPRLRTPGAELLGAVGVPPVPGVRAARAALRERGLLPEGEPAVEPAPAGARRRLRIPALSRSGAASRSARVPALQLSGVWHELRSGPAILRAISLCIDPGERVALMGANGAGKSTLLRHTSGLTAPTRGTVSAAGRVALLLQHPGDYLVHETVAREAPVAARRLVGLGDDSFAVRHPRELSGGERQRLALAVVLGDQEPPPAVICLDEPTRGMDREHRHQLADLLLGLGETAVLVATHDPEFAAAFAQRVVLLAGGSVIADAPARDVLTGGTWFATETARILGGAGAALTPAEGAVAVGRAPSG